MHGIPASKNVLDAEILSIAGNIEHDSDTCVNYLCSGSELPYLNVSNGNPDTTTYIIPLKKIGRLYILEAVVDGISGNLIFDTGATGLVLNRTYFRNHVKSGGISSSGITGGVGQVDKITADELSIGSLIYTGIPAHLADLGHIEDRRGIKVLGLFGFELIKAFQISIENNNMRLILRPVDSKGNILSGQNSGSWDEFIKIENLNNILFLKAQIADKNLRFCFDTGAETNVLNNSLNKSVLQTVSITRTVKLMGAGKSASEVIYGIMNNFKIGERELKNMQTIISYTDHLSDAFGTQVDGVLGFDFITRANFCINFEKGTMGIFYLNRE